MSDSNTDTVDLEHLQAGQEVYGSDGEPIGNVEGLTVDLDSGEPYLQVSHHLQTLYVPRSAIVYAVLGQPVRLNVPRDEAMSRFDTRPNTF